MKIRKKSDGLCKESYTEVQNIVRTETEYLKANIELKLENNSDKIQDNFNLLEKKWKIFNESRERLEELIAILEKRQHRLQISMTWKQTIITAIATAVPVGIGFYIT